LRKFTLDNLCYRGNRNYIQGADIYKSIYDILTTLHSDNNIRDFSLLIQKFTHKQNDVFISEPGENIDYPDELTARFSCKTSNGKILGYIVENNNIVDCRHPYNEEEIQKLCNIHENLIEFKGKVTYSPIEIVVSMTKYLHMQKYKDECQGKWIISKLQIKRLFRESDKNKISIQITRNFNYKLTKSLIICNNEVMGDIFFSLVGESK